MRKMFSFKGMTRNSENLLAEEGCCIEVMNLRAKDGTFVPLPRPKEVAAFETLYSKMFWHEMTQHYLCLTDDSSATLHLYDKNWNRVAGANGEPLSFDELQKVLNVEFHGYVACCITETGIVYLLYNDGCYRYLGERPPMPELEITLSTKLSRIITETAFNVSTTDNFLSSWRYNAKGFFDEAISSLNELGYYIDRAIFKFALRAYDGSYMAVSPAIYVSNEDTINSIGRDGYNLIAKPASGGNPSTYDVGVIGFKPKFSFKGLDLSNWKNVIVGIDVFTTGSIMGKKVKALKWRKRTLGTTGSEHVDYEAYVEKDFDDLCTEITDAAHFYKIAEYDLAGELVDSLENVSQTNLVLQQALENDDVRYTSIVPECSYMFNNRLHVGCLKEYFYKGYGPQFLKAVQGDRKTVEQITVMTRINATGGTSAVVRNYNNVELLSNDGGYELPALLSYPDVRAFEMFICLNTGTQFLCKTFPLTPHRFLNQAQYLNKWTLGYSVTVSASLSGTAALSSLRDEDVVAMFSGRTGTHQLVYSGSASAWMYNGSVFTADDTVGVRLVANRSDLADGDTIVFTITVCAEDSSIKDIRNISVDSSWTILDQSPDMSETNPFELRQNVLKVSAVDNPFSFPLRCTYTPSQGSIVALASNTVALSQGQFGQHPLYVFCNDGIWAMAVDVSGTVAYLASYPLSREVCVNGDSVCGIDGGVVFMGMQGLMLLSGGKIRKLSGMLDGNPELFSRIMQDATVAKISSMMSLECAAADDFAAFMNGAAVSYLPSHNELFIANEKYGYSFVYSFPYGTWGHVSFGVKGFVRSYSSFMMFVHENGRSRVMNMENHDSGDNNVLLVTRPQLWGTELPKRVVQFMLHAYSRPPERKTVFLPSLACYMFGSNDGVNFRLIAGRETEKETNDLRFPYFPTQSYRCFMFVVCGEMSAGSWITGIDIHAEQAWSNRLR